MTVFRYVPEPLGTTQKMHCLAPLSEWDGNLPTMQEAYNGEDCPGQNWVMVNSLKLFQHFFDGPDGKLEPSGFGLPFIRECHLK